MRSLSNWELKDITKYNLYEKLVDIFGYSVMIDNWLLI